ncbi:MAG: hypothetical protein RL385_4151 [Pseudomonadota bacterium]
MSRGDADFPNADKLAPSNADQVGRASSAGPRPALDALSCVPPLAYLATGAAVVHLLAQRIGLSLMASQKLTPPMFLLLAGPFALNLAAAAALVAFIAGSTELVRSGAMDTMRRRLFVTGLSAVLTSTAILSLVAPEAHVLPQHVMVATAATHMLVLQLSIVGVIGQRARAGRTAIALVSITSVTAVGSLLLRTLTILGDQRVAAVQTVHGLGELAFLLVPTASAFVVLPWDDSPAAKRARRAGFTAVCCMALAFTLAARLPGHLFSQLLFSTLKLEWALQRASLGYALPLSLGVGAAVAALAAPERRQRQGGAALWLWLCAGYNPLAPGRLLLLGLSVLLLCRAILAPQEEPATPSPAA